MATAMMRFPVDGTPCQKHRRDPEQRRCYAHRPLFLRVLNDNVAYRLEVQRHRVLRGGIILLAQG